MVVVCGLKKAYESSWCFRQKSRVDAQRNHGGRTLALAGVDVIVDAGTVLGLLGPNGAGKSTLFSILAGFIAPTAGSLRLAGVDVARDAHAVRRRMGSCPQDNCLWGCLTGAEHLRFFGLLKGLTGSELEAAVDDALRAVSLSAAKSTRAAAYSGGMRRRLSVAIAFIGAPDVVLLDEPTTGLDPASRKTVWAAVRRRKPGKAVLLTTHSMQEAEALCDRIGFLVAGRLVALGAPREIVAGYGGYHVLQLRVPEEREEDARRFVEMTLCPGARLVESCGGALQYELPGEVLSLAGALAAVAAVLQELSVTDFAVASATLEEVFFRIVSSTHV